MTNDDARKLFQNLTGNDPGKIGLKGIMKRGRQDTSSMDTMVLPSFGGTDSKVAGSKEQDAKIKALEKKIQLLENEKQQLLNDVKIAQIESRGAGKTEGILQGQKEGAAEARKEMKLHITDLQNETKELLQKLAQQHKASFKRLESESIELCIGLFVKLFPLFSNENQELIQNLLQQAMEHLGQSHKLIIRMNSKDLENTKASQDIWMPIISNIDDIEFKADDRITSGGVLLESDAGTLDSRIETLSAHMEEAIRASWQNHQSGDQ